MPDTDVGFTRLHPRSEDDLMQQFKAHADRIIKERWGIEVEHFRHKMSYEEMFYRPICRGPKEGITKGWPLTSNSRAWCKHLKVMNRLSPAGTVSYAACGGEIGGQHEN